MTDEKEIEGSAARAADRGREVDLGFSMDPRPSLGNQDVVRELMSKFGADVVDVRRDYLEDKITGPESQQRIRDLARDYGAIVMGRDDDYFSLPWNSESRLGRRIKLAVPAIEGISDPGELLFLTVGTSLASLAAAHENNRVSDAEAENHTQTMLGDAADLILGLR